MGVLRAPQPVEALLKLTGNGLTGIFAVSHLAGMSRTCARPPLSAARSLANRGAAARAGMADDSQDDDETRFNRTRTRHRTSMRTASRSWVLPAVCTFRGLRPGRSSLLPRDDAPPQVSGHAAREPGRNDRRDAV